MSMFQFNHLNGVHKFQLFSVRFYENAKMRTRTSVRFPHLHTRSHGCFVSESSHMNVYMCALAPLPLLHGDTHKRGTCFVVSARREIDLGGGEFSEIFPKKPGCGNRQLTRAPSRPFILGFCEEIYKS